MDVFTIGLIIFVVTCVVIFGIIAFEQKRSNKEKALKALKRAKAEARAKAKKEARAKAEAEAEVKGKPCGFNLIAKLIEDGKAAKARAKEKQRANDDLAEAIAKALRNP